MHPPCSSPPPRRFSLSPLFCFLPGYPLPLLLPPPCCSLLCSSLSLLSSRPSLFFAPLPLLSLLLTLSLSPFASSIVATLSTLHHRYLRQPYPRPTIIRSRSTAPRSTLFGYGFLMRGHGNEVLHMAYSEGWVRDT